MTMHGPASILPLEVRSVSLEVDGRRLVDGLDFTLGKAGRTLIIGPNGAGKSLTLRLCHGLVAPTAGSVRWTGAQAANGRKRHAMVFQAPVMLRRSVRANLVHALAVQGWARRERHGRAERAIERFGLGAIAERSARVISGGERQRVAIARAWALAPEVIFLDEPTSALDPAATHAIETLIRDLEADGVKVVMTTHNLGQARRLADEVMFLNKGRLLEHQPAGSFFAGPATAEARAFLNGELLW